MNVAGLPAVLGRRVCAALAAGSAALHSAMLFHSANLATGVLMAGMIVACLYCVCELWQHGTLRAWCVVALMNLTMVALHLPAPLHHHGALVASVEQPSALMVWATGLSAVEVAAAVVVLYYRSRIAAQHEYGQVGSCPTVRL